MASIDYRANGRSYSLQLGDPETKDPIEKLVVSLINNSVQAILKAADRLEMSPDELAEKLRDGQIADIINYLSELDVEGDDSAREFLDKLKL